MSHSGAGTSGPDLGDGTSLARLVEGEPLFGHVGGAPVYVVRVGASVRAFGAKCTHYGGSLAQGLVHGGTVRCPLHHACFSLDDGSLLGGPAFNPLPPYDVEVRDGTVFVGEKQPRDPLASAGIDGEPGSRDMAPGAGSVGAVVIVGAGPAGTTAAETLRREGHEGPVFLVDGDPDAPYDRPNLSKDYLAGEAQEAWMPLRSDSFFGDHGIDRVISRITEIDREKHTVTLDSGEQLAYEALLLAPGATARTLDGPGMNHAHVRTLRSWEDCRRIIEMADRSRHAVVLGASFIGMEAAASLRARGLDVTVVAPEEVPFARTLGPELGAFIQSVHAEGGVSFRLGRTAAEVRSDEVVLDDGTRVPADLVVVGVGVTPDLSLARSAGLEVDNGIVVDRYLRTSDPNIFAAGDVARFPDSRTGNGVRIEHWVVAGRQGRTAARNILGRQEPFTDVPFFWTSHFGRSVTYVGHAESWDRTEQDGDCDNGGCSVAYWKDGRRLALAAVGRPRRSLEAEREMERESE